ncbi:MAG: hypothetical protein WD928_11930 [Gammaproteobacteria bacterium]
MTASRPALLIVLLTTLLLSACARVPLPGFARSADEAETPAVAADRTATPRDLLGARLVNPPVDPDTPRMTVGKFIEFADRYLACDCANTRFVHAWEKTAEGYRLTTNSAAVRPLEFVCRSDGEQSACFLTEIDRGAHITDFEERFVPGAEFIQFLYDNGVSCARETPCP